MTALHYTCGIQCFEFSSNTRIAPRYQGSDQLPTSNTTALTQYTYMRGHTQRLAGGVCINWARQTRSIRRYLTALPTAGSSHQVIKGMVSGHSYCIQAWVLPRRGRGRTSCSSERVGSVFRKSLIKELLFRVLATSDSRRSSISTILLCPWVQTCLNSLPLRLYTSWLV